MYSPEAKDPRSSPSDSLETQHTSNIQHLRILSHSDFFESCLTLFGLCGISADFCGLLTMLETINQHRWRISCRGTGLGVWRWTSPERSTAAAAALRRGKLGAPRREPKNVRSSGVSSMAGESPGSMEVFQPVFNGLLGEINFGNESN